MSIHGECFDNGDSGRCNLYDCEKFNAGKCDIPEDIIGHDEGVIPADVLEEIYSLYPSLIPKTIKERKTMNKIEKGLTVQKKDRTDAANKLLMSVHSLTKIKQPEGCVLFNDDTKEIYSETIQVPVKVVCLETDGARYVYFNAIGAGETVFSVLASKELVESLRHIQDAVSDEDAALGCENLNSEVSKLL